jgi:hypothetical protein
MEGKEIGEIKWEKKKVTVHLGRFPSLQPTSPPLLPRAVLFHFFRGLVCASGWAPLASHQPLPTL